MKEITSLSGTPELEHPEAKSSVQQEQPANERKRVPHILALLNQPFIWIEKRAIEPTANFLDKADIFRIIEKISPIIEAIGVIAIPVMIWYFTETSEASREQQEKAVRAQQSVENYLNQLSDTLLQGDLAANEKLRTITRARTLALFNNPDLQFNPELTAEENLRNDRKGQVVGYLQETGLIEILDTPLNKPEIESNESWIFLMDEASRQSLIYLGESNLSYANLSRFYLPNANLSYVDLHHANLSNANLSNASLFNANLSHTNLSHANLTGTEFGKSLPENSSLSYYYAVRVSYQSTNLSDADLSGANLSGANLNRTDLIRANLSGANLSSTDLSYADLSAANLITANLNYANLYRANLSGANLRDANLSTSTFIYANVNHADFTGTDLSRADFTGVDFMNASLSNAKLQNTILLAANFQNSQGLLQEQLTTADSPFLCKTNLPVELKHLSDRDCDRLASVLVEYYPDYFRTQDEAKQYIEDIVRYRTLN